MALKKYQNSTWHSSGGWESAGDFIFWVPARAKENEAHKYSRWFDFFFIDYLHHVEWKLKCNSAATWRPYKAASVSHLWPSVWHTEGSTLWGLCLNIFFVIVFGCVPVYTFIWIDLHIRVPNGSHFRLNCRFGGREIQFLSNFQIRVSTQFTLNGRAGEKRAFIQMNRDILFLVLFFFYSCLKKWLEGEKKKKHLCVNCYRWLPILKRAHSVTYS